MGYQMKYYVLLLCSFFLSTTYSQWISKGIGGGGAVFSVSISPYNGNEIFLSCDMSDMFRSTDFGTSWSTIPYQQLVAFHHTVVRFTDDSQILYTLKNTTGGYAPVKSTDGGSSWFVITNPAQSASRSRCFELYAHPQKNNVLIVSDIYNLYASFNGGNTFSTFYLSDTTAKGIHLAGVFFDNENVYVCANKRLFVSSDTGHTFSSYGVAGIDTLQEEIVWFEGTKQGGVSKFYCTTLTPSTVVARTSGGDVLSFKGVYTMNYDDAGWTSIKGNLPEPGVDKAYHIAVLPNDTSLVYLSGSTIVNINGSHAVHTVFKSTNGGASFTNMFLNDPVIQNNGNVSTGWLGWGGTQHNWFSVSFPGGLAVDPHDANRVIVTNSSVPHITTDGGVTWQQAYVQQADAHIPGQLINDADSYTTNGMETTVCYWLTWADSVRMIAGFADLLTEISTDGGNKWSFNYTGLFAPKINDMSIILKHPVNNTYYAAVGDVAGSNGDFTDARVKLLIGKIVSTTDKGQTWQTLHDFQKTVSWIALDPHNPNRMYATIMDTLGGVGAAYVCNDITNPASTWDSLSSPPRTQGRAKSIFALNDGSLVMTYDGRDSANFHYTSSAGVFYSTDSGKSWQDKSFQGMLINVNSFEIDPNDTTQQTWLVSVTSLGTNQAGLYRTTNRGDIWDRIFTSGTQSCTFHPYVPNEMYLCTETQGLYYVTGTNLNSPTFTQDNTFPFRKPQRVFFNPYNPNEVWAMTYGNGMRMGASAHTVYSISALSGAGGEISPAGKLIVGGDGTQTFYFSADSGYQIDSVFVDGQYVGNDTSYILSVLQSNHTIYATFKYQTLFVAVQTKLQQYWNLVSVPLVQSDYSKANLFPGAISNAYSFEGNYQSKDTLKNSVGYWLKSDSVRTVQFTGLPRTNDTISVQSGWNLIGVLSSPFAINQITSVPPGIVTSEFYSYNNGYLVSDTLFPGKGYWVKTAQNAQLLLNQGSVLSSAKLIFSYDNELPPSPPGEGLSNDIEFPKEFSLQQNYPNPFNPSTTITYQLPEKNPGIHSIYPVAVKIYSLLGEELTTLVNEAQPAGTYLVQWDASVYPSGIYICQITAGDYTSVAKMLLMR